MAFRRRKNLANYLIKYDLKKPDDAEKLTKPCGKYHLCPYIETATTITNKKRNIQCQIKSGGTCQTKNVVYAAICKRCNLINVGHTGESLATRFSKHKYDIKKRPSNSELAEHLHKDHQLDNDLKVMILQSGLPNAAERKYFEDRWMCKLQTLNPTGMNTDCGAYTNEVYTSWKAVTSSVTSPSIWWLPSVKFTVLHLFIWVK